MLTANKVLVTVFIVCCSINGCMFGKIPDYVKICKREQSTIDVCVREAVEQMRPRLAEGIPELNVPSIDPFYIPEIKTTSGELAQLRASAKDVKVSGAGNFVIKSVSVDLDTFTIKARVRFPKLHLEGRYKLNTRVLLVPLQGQGNMIADATKCDTELVLYSQLYERDGKEYLKFTKLDADVNVKDYQLRLDGLFNGDKTLGEVTNQAINQNKGEFLKATKPYLELTVSRILLDAANKVVKDTPLDELLPRP